MICTHLLPRSSATFLKDFLSKKPTAFEENIPLASGEADEDVPPNVEAAGVPAFTGYESDLSDGEPIEVVVDRMVHTEAERGGARGELSDSD